MSGSKRSCPFSHVEGGRSPGGHVKALKEDIASIHEATLNKLKLGARSNAVKHHHVGGDGVSSDPSVAMEKLTIHSHTTAPQLVGGPRPCYVCTCRSFNSVCFHCSRACCLQCCRRCEGCHEIFCSICCTLNYSERYERGFCFDCNADLPTPSRSHKQSTCSSPIQRTCIDQVRGMDLQ